jgi:hypothetical protein
MVKAALTASAAVLVSALLTSTVACTADTRQPSSPPAGEPVTSAIPSAPGQVAAIPTFKSDGAYAGGTEKGRGVLRRSKDGCLTWRGALALFPRGTTVDDADDSLELPDGQEIAWWLPGSIEYFRIERVPNNRHYDLAGCQPSPENRETGVVLILGS